MDYFTDELFEDMGTNIPIHDCYPTEDTCPLCN